MGTAKSKGSAPRQDVRPVAASEPCQLLLQLVQAPPRLLARRGTRLSALVPGSRGPAMGRMQPDSTSCAGPREEAWEVAGVGEIHFALSSSSPWVHPLSGLISVSLDLTRWRRG